MNHSDLDSIEPTQAEREISEDGNATYLDVRTVAEFAKGRPKGRAVNVPLEFYHPSTQDTHPNEAFILVLETIFDRAHPIIIGADSASPRAENSAVILNERGFTNLSILKNGVDAWAQEHLAVTKDNREGVSYVSLLTRARRAGAKK